MRERVRVIKQRLMSGSRGGEVRVDCASLCFDDYRRAASRITDLRENCVAVLLQEMREAKCRER
jgi:hypothetical protein